MNLFCFSTFGYCSLANRRGARNKRGGGKDEPFLISVVPVISVVLSGISMVVRIFRPATVIKKKNELKFLIKKEKSQKSGASE